MPVEANENPYTEDYLGSPEYPPQHRVSQTVAEQKRRRRRKVTRDGAGRGAVTGPLLGILAGLAVQYGLPQETGEWLTQPATVTALVAIVAWAARIAEAAIADTQDSTDY